MLLSNKIPITSIIKGAWRVFFFITLTSTCTYILYEYFLAGKYDLPGMIPTVLGTALAFFIGFKNNQAYDRWWEARKIWGSLVNDSRTWARQILYYTTTSQNIPPDKLNAIRSSVLKRHIAFLYALKEFLREEKNGEYNHYLSEEDITSIMSKSNKHNAILNLQSKDLGEMKSNGVIDGFMFIELNKSLIAFCDKMGMSERIKNTVFPSIYHRYTRMFIWIFIVCVTAVASGSIGIWSILLGTVVGLIYVVSHMVGMTLLNPFDQLITGIPLNQITRTIEINLLETLGESNIPEPINSIKDKYIM